MAKTSSILCENIKSLRKIHGESQQELGDALHVGSTTIANYESGVRQPDLQTLQAIASHYGYPVDQLIRSSFSDTNPVNFSADWRKIMEMLEIMFPIACSNKALEDPHFKKGYDYNLQIRDAIKKGDTPMQGIVDLCWESYQKSLKESETMESVVNLLGLLFVSWSSIYDEYTIKIGEALLNHHVSGSAFIKDFVLRYGESNNEENETAKQQFIRDNSEFITTCLRLLKSSPEWADLADYYLALKYVIGMVDTDFGNGLNKTIGMEMMLSYLTLGNPYAFSFVKKSLEL